MPRVTDRVRRFLQRLARVTRQLVGAPDYETYLEHCRRAGHPARLTRAAYIDEVLERKAKTRCC
jgi:uncharacterized short protein YbdD (DUF466 family)